MPIFPSSPSFSAQSAESLQFATPSNLARAGRVAESLLNSTILFTQLHASEIGSLMTMPTLETLNNLIARQEPFTRAFTELSTAVLAFQADIYAKEAQPKSHSTVSPNTQKAILTLALYQATIRLLLLRDPDNPDLSSRANNMDTEYSQIVDSAEAILAMGDTSKDRAMAFTPTSYLLSPLFLVAHGAGEQALRRRAVELMCTTSSERGTVG